MMLSAVGSFVLMWFGALGTVVSFCVWWLPLRTNHLSQVLQETAWPEIITAFFGLSFAVGTWTIFYIHERASAPIGDETKAEIRENIGASGERVLEAKGRKRNEASSAIEVEAMCTQWEPSLKRPTQSALFR